MHRTFVPESQPTTLARRIARSCQQRQGIIVFGNDHPAVHDALRRCREAGVPAITLATDLPGADRLCHVGINQLQAGRTAGLMLGRMTPRPGEVLMVSGRQDYSAHRLRIQGFREVLSQRFPHLQLSDVLAGEERREQITRLVEQALCRSRNIVGIYNTGLGNTQIAEALARHRREGDVCWITISVQHHPAAAGEGQPGVNARSEHPPARPAGDRPDAAPSGVRLPAANLCRR